MLGPGRVDDDIRLFERQQHAGRPDRRGVMLGEIIALLVERQGRKPFGIEPAVEQVDACDPDIGAQLDDLALRIEDFAIFAHRREPFILEAVGQHRPTEPKQALHRPRRQLEIAPAREKGAGIKAVHQRTIVEAEQAAPGRFDHLQPVDEFAHEAAQRAGQACPADRDPGQRVAAVGKAPHVAQHLVARHADIIAQVEQRIAWRVQRIALGQHQLLDLANVRRSEHVEETADFSGRFAVVIGIDHRRDMQPGPRQQRRDKRSGAAPAIEDNHIQHLFFPLPVRPAKREPSIA